MSGFDIRFPDRLKPHIDAYKQACVGLLGWQILDPGQVDQVVSAAERAGKSTMGIALSKDLEGLPPGPSPNVSHSIRKALSPLVLGQNHHRLITSLTPFMVGHCSAILEEEGRIKAHWQEPVVQYLRHVRNGCFHGNRLNITVPEQKWLPAVWRGKEITRSMNGGRVFRESLEEKEFFLNWGDAILLLSDACELVWPR